ncbi:MAG: hypothetical protein GX996_02525 [Firmicutes bacterium]|nr:hypothetical protein [Bacillota bacterium]
MKITKVEMHSEQKLIDRLRKVTLLNNHDFYIYQDALMSLEKISTDFLSPAQYYVLDSALERVVQLKWELLKNGVNIYELNGYVTLHFEDHMQCIDLLPPVVEESIENNGSVVNLINDGMHRLFMARLDMVVPQVVFIRGVPKQYPYYAYPAPNGWQDAVLVEKVPKNLLKKWHRIESYRDLYRNFNSAFQNVGRPRPVGAKGS